MKINDVTFAALTPAEQEAVKIGNLFGEALAAKFAEALRMALDGINRDLVSQLMPKVRERLLRGGREDLASRLEGEEGFRLALDSIKAVFQEIKLELSLVNKYNLEPEVGGVHVPELLPYPDAVDRPKLSLATPFGTLAFEW